MSECGDKERLQIREYGREGADGGEGWGATPLGRAEEQRRSYTLQVEKQARLKGKVQE